MASRADAASLRGALVRSWGSSGHGRYTGVAPAVSPGDANARGAAEPVEAAGALATFARLAQGRRQEVLWHQPYAGRGHGRGGAGVAWALSAVVAFRKTNIFADNT